MNTLTKLPDPQKIKIAHFKLWALRHKKRMAIIDHLYLVGCSNVTDLVIHFRTRQDEMSQMLMILRKAGVVQTERLGKEIFYSVDEEQLNKIYSAVRKFFGNGKK